MSTVATRQTLVLKILRNTTNNKGVYAAAVVVSLSCSCWTTPCLPNSSMLSLRQCLNGRSNHPSHRCPFHIFDVSLIWSKKVCPGVRECPNFTGMRGCLAFFVSLFNDKLKAVCDVVHVISINVDIDIVTPASFLASHFFLLCLCPNIRLEL